MSTVLKNLPAPAKLNLFLHIVGRRPDGYHLLESVFVLIDLADTLSIESLDKPTFERTGDIIGPAEKDLCLRAARLLAQKTGTNLGARIHVEKRIPAGAGLGGGSSDAATTLLTLNRLWNLNLTRAELSKIGLELGADVPFFLFGENAFAAGVGEKLTAVHVPESLVAIAMPATPTPTKAVFSSPFLTRDTPAVTVADFENFTHKSWPELFGRNDMERAAREINPEISKALSLLGAGSRMTGSGSAVFRLIKNSEEGKTLLRCLPTSFQGFIAKILPSHPLKSQALG